MLEVHQRLRHARDLYVIAARACSFMSAALGDLGRQAEAAAYARTALTLAEEAGDPGTVALALSALSKVAFWDGRRDHAADLAARGFETARESDAVRVLPACQIADAAPVPRAREAIALAADALDAAGPHEPGLFHLQPGPRRRIRGYPPAPRRRFPRGPGSRHDHGGGAAGR